MPVFDTGFKIVARTGGRELAAVGGVRWDRWTPIVSEVQTTERLADRAFRARRGRQRFVVYFEGYTTWRREAPWSILAKSALLSERERLPTRSLLFVLRPRGYRPQHGEFRLSVDRHTTQLVCFREVCLWKLEPQMWWEDVLGLMPLYPLTRHPLSGRDAVMHAAEVIQRTEPDTVVRADLLTTLAIFGKLAYPRLDALGLIGREQMKESRVYEEIKEEGRLEARRASLLEAIEIRFGPVAASEFSPLIAQIDDPQRLAHLHRLALRCSTVDDFRNAFAQV